MYGLNAVALVFFGCINVLAYHLCKCPRSKRRSVVLALSAALLCGNLLKYCVYYPLVEGAARIPVEFSAVAYFAVPLILLTKLRPLHCWAAYSGLMAGFFYYMAMIIAGGAIYSTYPPAETYVSMLCHGTLYFCGFVTVGSEVFRRNDAAKLLLGVALVALQAVLLRPFADNGSPLLIYILLDADLVRGLLPQSALTLALPLYYLALFGLVLLSIFGFLRKNKRQYRKFSC